MEPGIIKVSHSVHTRKTQRFIHKTQLISLNFNDDEMWSQRKYRGSAQERVDLGRLYIEYDGDMDRIMESALCAETEDEPRIRDILQSLIDAQEIPAFRVFTHESAQKRRNRRRKVEMEREEAEMRQKEMGITSEDSLDTLIKRKQQSNEQRFNTLISELEEKYCEVEEPKKEGAE